MHTRLLVTRSTSSTPSLLTSWWRNRKAIARRTCWTFQISRLRRRLRSRMRHRLSKRRPRNARARRGRLMWSRPGDRRSGRIRRRIREHLRRSGPSDKDYHVDFQSSHIRQYDSLPHISIDGIHIQYHGRRFKLVCDPSGLIPSSLASKVLRTT